MPGLQPKELCDNWKKLCNFIHCGIVKLLPFMILQWIKWHNCFSWFESMHTCFVDFIWGVLPTLQQSLLEKVERFYYIIYIYVCFKTQQCLVITWFIFTINRKHIQKTHWHVQNLYINFSNARCFATETYRCIHYSFMAPSILKNNFISK